MLLRILSSFALFGACDGGDALPTKELPPPVIASQGSIKPASLAGGTLLMGTNGKAWVANPDADAVDVVDLANEEIVWTARLPASSEPGRMWQSVDGKVYVVLRGRGAIAILDAATQTVDVHDVCSSPRGIAGSSSSVLIACATGELVTLRLDGTFVNAKIVGRDLRDVVIGGDGTIYVTRFRSASLVTVGSRIVQEERPPVATISAAEAGMSTLQPHVARRTILGPDGAVYMLHQYANERTLSIGFGNVSPYGGQGCVGRPVSAAITRFVNGIATGTAILPMPPGIDFAFRSPTEIFIVGGAGRTATIVSPTFSSQGPFCEVNVQPSALDRIPVAVGIAENGKTYAQTRDPAQLVVPFLNAGFIDASSSPPGIALSPSIANVGLEIFETPTSAGIACSSCHPEGGDDGHVWSLTSAQGVIRRRTPSLHGGLLATAPFHWDGSETDLGVLMDDVFVGRMGGHPVTAGEVEALGQWLNAMPKLPPPAWLDAQAAARGKAIFEGKAGCAACHAGPHFTNNQTMDVGTGGAFQVPSLVNVAARTPLMHDGCAATLHDRLTKPACAGSSHGSTSDLSDEELADLETYMESL